MGKIEKLKEQNALTTINDADLAALGQAARDLQPKQMVGVPIKFVKGAWTIHREKDNKERVNDQHFIVDARSYEEGWMRWENKKPTHRIMGRRVDGFVSPPRHVLPEFDEKEWPVGPSGLEDPWSETQTLVMRQADSGDLVTWPNTSYGGRKALDEFFEAYVAEAKQHPGMMPIVELSSYDRQSADYGPIPTPQLTIVGWDDFGDDASPPGDPKQLQPLQQQLRELQTLALPKPAAAPAKGKRGDMDDEVPF